MRRSIKRIITVVVLLVLVGGTAAWYLQRAQRNLDYCTIRSPVKGVIIDFLAIIPHLYLASHRSVFHTNCDVGGARPDAGQKPQIRLHTTNELLLRSNHPYRVGSTSSMAMVEVNRPPMAERCPIGLLLHVDLSGF